ncbi:hypothetical protein Pla110_24980 [Polystyrenella longa]|uniref:SMB domain-containing protein n=1 Tax=Polystyrenella longa TaxID=2528007 RepID=A0A518CNG1_9PLAN|nr:hypothetical protein Pla110_24980 [Polystyrenella longa]
MSRKLVCLLGFLTAWGFVNLTVAQEPQLFPASSCELTCDTVTCDTGTYDTGTCDSMMEGSDDCCPCHHDCVGSCFPANCCCDDYTPRPFPRSCYPTYPSWYKCVPAGDVSCSGSPRPSKEKRTWWFISKCHTLREALWLDP